MAKRRKAGITKVPDRTLGVPLGREARAAVESLRAYGADPDCVPPLDDAEACKEWLQARSRPARNVERWVLDLAMAVLKQIPDRVDRPRGRRRDAATDELEFWQLGGGEVATDARMIETLRTRREENPANENVPDEERKVTKVGMEATQATRAENLARRVYKRRGKRRKPDVPKLK